MAYASERGQVTVWHVNDEGLSLDDAVAAWQDGRETPDFVAHVLDWTESLTVRCRRERPHLRNDDDLPSEIQLWLLETMSAWRPGEGNASGYIASRFEWWMSRYGQVMADMPSKGWHRVAAIASDILDSPEGRALSLEGLRQECRQRIETQLAANIQAANPDWSARRVASQVQGRLRKDGYANALEQLSEIVLHCAPLVRLDALVAHEDGDASIGGGVADSTRDTAADERRYDELVHVMLGDADWARQALNARFGATAEGTVSSVTFESLAAETGHTVAQVKAAVKLAPVRVAAPHAQWAHLAEVSAFQRAESAEWFTFDA